MFHPKGPTFFELARQALSSTERGYDLLAPKFDYTPFRTPDWILSVVASRLCRFAPFGSVLDVGCGTGAAMLALLPLCQSRMVGIDISQGMLEMARKNTQIVKTSVAVQLVRDDVLAMPFAAEFDLAVSFGAFGHILPTHEPQFVREVARALRPGGIFAFVTSAAPPFWSQRYWLCRSFNAAMRLRNWLIKPPFIMYYLTFLLPDVANLLAANGFTVCIERPFSGRHRWLRLLIAVKDGGCEKSYS